MVVSYIGLWENIVRKKTTKTGFGWTCRIDSATVAKMGRREPVFNKVLEKVCAYLECSVNDIISYE